MTDYVYGNNNEMTDAGAVDLTYDHFGNLSSFDDGTEVTNLTYDFERHMKRIETTDIITFDEHEYDGDGRRMRSKLNLSMTWRNFIHDELTEEILCEYEISGGVPTIKALFTWGIGLISTTFNTTKRWYHFDGLGNTLALTDYDETVTDTYQWSAFGKLESSTGSSTNPFRFVGQWGYYDDGARGSQFGLLLLGVRYYSPTWGRFLVWDSIVDNNAYVYCHNSSPNAIDSDGEQATYIARPHRLPFMGSKGQFLGWSYGAYCGSKNQRNPAWRVLPQDCVDACCMQHDRCLEGHYGAGYSQRAAHKCCDQDARNCAMKSIDNGCCGQSEDPDACKAAARQLMRGMWVTTRIVFRGRKPGCLPANQWVSFARSHWGNPHCSTPSGVGINPPKD